MLSILLKRVKAVSLIYAIFIILLITLVLSSVIGLVYFEKLEFERYRTLHRLIINANSGIELMATNGNMADIDVDLFGKNQDSVFLKRTPWGLMQIATATAHKGNQRFKKSALMGQQYPDSSSTALYLADNGRALNICGATLLKGICYIPEGLAKETYIEGTRYNKSQLIFGNIHRSKNVLPEISAGLKSQFSNLLSDTSAWLSSYISDENQIDSIENSFDEQTRVIASSSAIIVDKRYIAGNVIIYSAKKVYVPTGTCLKDVIIVSPCIEFEQGFTGSVQAIAQDSILVGAKCRFNYPSVLALLPARCVSPKIKIGEYSKIAGTIILWQQTPSITNSPAVELSKGSVLIGMLYNSGTSFLKGKIWGSAYTTQLMLVTNSGTYQNQLLDTEINREQLPTEFAFLNILQNYQKQKICKWLN